MRQNLFMLLCCAGSVISSVQAQAVREYAMEVSVASRSLDSVRSVLDFSWPYQAPAAQEQRVYRTLKGILKWDTSYRIIPSTDSTFSDTVTTGVEYEYKFEKDTAPDGSTAYGYVLAGNKIPAVTQRGTILIIADSTHKTFLENDIRTYRNDLIGDGWFTHLKWFDSATSVTQIKSYIVSMYNASPAQVRSVVLIGNLKAPYSGDFRTSSIWPPDGHTDHSGAWPADMYFSNMLVPVWPDSTVNNTIGARPENNNTPGDGKFDYTIMPHYNTLEVGRIDLSEMPAFSLNERSLLSQYLQRNHRFRHHEDVLTERCLTDDNFGVFSNGLIGADEHFGTVAYSNMAPLFGSGKTFARDYLSTLDTSDYLWSFGLGAGGYTSCSGVANTSQFANSSQEIRSVFTGLFGSYFGDWDNQNNLLRAPLAAAGNVLNSFWCGRPIYFFHHMGLGETIGYSILRTQNNLDSGTNQFFYPTTTASLWNIHVSLMGDPAVRMQFPEPVAGFTAVQDGCADRVKLSWSAPADTAVHRYYIFRSKHIDSTFTLLGTSDTIIYTDSFPLFRNNVYMVRSEKLQVSASGSYYNLGQGLFDTVVLMRLNAAKDTTVCSGTRIRLGEVNSNGQDVIYQWSPAAGNRDTFSLTVNSSGNRILTATDTAGGCILRDTIAVTALSIPVSESISALTNTCNDTVIWSSTLNNGAGFLYTWNFAGGSPSLQSGHMLDSPSMVVYPSVGTYLTILRVTDTATTCYKLDTQDVTVVCTGLPLTGAVMNCLGTNGKREIRFMVYDNVLYHGYRIEGFDGYQWVEIETIPVHADKYYRFGHNSFERMQIIRVSGLKPGVEPVFLSQCEWGESLPEWTVFPNPFNHEFVLAYNGVNGGLSTRITLFNQYGVVVFETELVFNENELFIRPGELPAGIYTLHVMTGEKIFTGKLFAY